jgi:hypothetical protein
MTGHKQGKQKARCFSDPHHAQPVYRERSKRQNSGILNLLTESFKVLKVILYTNERLNKAKKGLKIKSVYRFSIFFHGAKIKAHQGECTFLIKERT